MANAERIVACVNAMEGIEDPEGFVLLAKQMAEFTEMFKIRESVTDLLKYKTACEGINPDNPMAVAENLKELYEKFKAITESEEALRLHKVLSEVIEANKALLTKIQAK